MSKPVGSYGGVYDDTHELDTEMQFIVDDPQQQESAFPSIGFVGLGKLGLPVAVAIAERGYKVLGYDNDEPKVEAYMAGRGLPDEPGIKGKLRPDQGSHLLLGCTLEYLVQGADIIFVAVPTPHGPRHDGTQPFDPTDKQPFDTSILKACLQDIMRCLPAYGPHKTIAVISTVLPGTMRDEMWPAIQEVLAERRGEEIPGAEGPPFRFDLCYNPLFIAMGQVMQDFLRPEFVLIGAKAGWSGDKLRRFYEGFYGLQATDGIWAGRIPPIFVTSFVEAEVVKMAYNTFIGQKIVFANTLMEMCHKLGDANVDSVVDVLACATDRLLSPRYLRGGMGDGGPCHPRDNVALSWLADQLKLSADPFAFVMSARDRQTAWIAEIVEQIGNDTIVAGAAFKSGTSLTDGSASILLADLLWQRGLNVALVDPRCAMPVTPALSTDREEPRTIIAAGMMVSRFPWFQELLRPGDTVIDPWRVIEEVPEGVKLIRLGTP